jgi:hypothetical protein
MRFSAHSADLAQNKREEEFWFNPISSKLRAGVNHQNRGSGESAEQGSILKQVSLSSNLTRNNPVVFHYSSPNPGIDMQPGVLGDMGQSLGRPQVQLVSYPVPVQTPIVRHWAASPPGFHKLPESIFCAAALTTSSSSFGKGEYYPPT